MARVFRTQAAQRDLDRIFAHVERYNRAAAARLLERIGQRADIHSRSPLLGTPCPELGEAVRSFTVRAYVAYYVPHRQGIALIRVLHSARDLPEVFATGDE